MDFEKWATEHNEAQIKKYGQDHQFFFITPYAANMARQFNRSLDGWIIMHQRVMVLTNRRDYPHTSPHGGGSSDIIF